MSVMNEALEELFRTADKAIPETKRLAVRNRWTTEESRSWLRARLRPAMDQPAEQSDRQLKN
jgi:hypothetical protein